MNLLRRPNRPYRSMGRLDIGVPRFNHVTGDFFCVMTFHSKERIGDDQMKSAMLMATRQFKMLLNQNGYWNYSDPAVSLKGDRDRTLQLTMSCRVRRLFVQ